VPIINDGDCITDFFEAKVIVITKVHGLSFKNKLSCCEKNGILIGCYKEAVVLLLFIKYAYT
jgi:hypothetical protein